MPGSIRSLLMGVFKFCNAPMTWNGNHPPAVCVTMACIQPHAEAMRTNQPVECHGRESFRQFRMLNSEGRSGRRSRDYHAPSFNT
jgi:hypothetical protein